MLFHSITFIIFFVLFLCALPLFQGKARIIYAAIGSYIFYGWWYPPYIILLLGLTLYAYFIAQNEKNLSSLGFGFLIAGAILPLLVFKYTGFIFSNLNNIFGLTLDLERVHWMLPLGISFVTFTIIAYMVDVRLGKFPVEKNFFNFALYISFFPQLIAGPIMRPHELLPQIKNIIFKRNNLKWGLLIFMFGYIKKVVFADQIAVAVDQVYQPDALMSLPRSIFALYGFTIQVYCDFSGYMDMALGCALLCGIRLPLNFNRPFHATSIENFWRNWHMTLTRWLTDYLFIPIGVNRSAWGRWGGLFAIIVTFVICGLWHGAAWTFVAWGLVHAIVLTLEYLFSRRMKKKINIPRWVGQIWTFHVFAISMIMFRSQNFEMIGQIFSGFVQPGDWTQLWQLAYFPIILIILCLLVHYWDRLSTARLLAQKLPASLICAVFVIVIVGGVTLSAGSANSFIYFDF